MTGYASTALRHVCSRDGCYIAGLPLWDDLIGCFPRGIRPTDIDGLVEINGHILLIEEKKAGAGPDEGQRRALVALSRKPDVTVLLMRPAGSGLTTAVVECLVLGGETLLDGWEPSSGWKTHARSWLMAWLGAWVEKAEEAG